MCVDIAAGGSAWHPDSRAGRTHSLPFCVATALANASISYSDFDDQPAEYSKVFKLMSKVNVAEDLQMTAEFPQNSPCKITIVLNDGSKISASRDYPHGDAKDPMTNAEIEEKLLNYFFFSEGNEAKEVLDQLYNIEGITSVSKITKPLKRRRINSKK